LTSYISVYERLEELDRPKLAITTLKTTENRVQVVGVDMGKKLYEGPTYISTTVLGSARVGGVFFGKKGMQVLITRLLTINQRSNLDFFRRLKLELKAAKEPLKVVVAYLTELMVEDQMRLGELMVHRCLYFCIPRLVVSQHARL
jgi:hypothetical protein